MSPKRQDFSELHGVATQKTVLFFRYEINGMINSDLNPGAVVFPEQSLHAASSRSATVDFLSIIYFMLYVVG